MSWSTSRVWSWTMSWCASACCSCATSRDARPGWRMRSVMTAGFTDSVANMSVLSIFAMPLQKGRGRWAERGVASGVGRGGTRQRIEKKSRGEGE
ncbi:hypothetical protein FA10DRAFT_18309 [Acaromyces ingoldii]|uniref:Secreted protein n=1 Tax=Acaromyces ingoldii TaxID=215250 RepID=A0A316YVY6_9BASI|nr:hypothetical protein FA10DRAFT_18309 [Acaromyces ingoldii]PWN93292.1 hypothetical protein FA10DRAFT_18309 [Acaromyces ingoldii]